MANPRPQAEGRGDDRLTGRTRRQRAQGLQERRARRAMHGTVDPSAPDQRHVRRRDDDVDVRSGDVTQDNLDLHEFEPASIRATSDINVTAQGKH
jgi:hypothetical protein